MRPRLTVYLKPEELDALVELAQREFRDPRSEAALIICQELEKKGLLIINPPIETPRKIGQKVAPNGC